MVSVGGVMCAKFIVDALSAVVVADMHERIHLVTEGCVAE